MKKRSLKGIMIPIGLFALTIVLIVGLCIVISIFGKNPIYKVEAFEGAYQVSAGLLVREDGKFVRVYSEISGHTDEYPIVEVGLSDGRMIKGAFVGETLFGTDGQYAGLNAANTADAFLYIDEHGQKLVYSFKHKTYTPLFAEIKGVFDEYATKLLPLSTNGTYFLEFQDHVFHILKRDRQEEGIAVKKEILTVDLNPHTPTESRFLGWLNDRYFAFTVQTKRMEISYFMCDALTGEYRATSREVCEEIVSVSYVLREKEDGMVLVNLMDGEETRLTIDSVSSIERPIAVSPEQNYLCFESGGEIYLHNMKNGKTRALKDTCDLQVDSIDFLHRCVILVVGRDDNGQKISTVYRLTF